LPVSISDKKREREGEREDERERKDAINS